MFWQAQRGFLTNVALQATSVPPVLTYRSGVLATGTGTSQTATALSIGAASARKMVIVSFTGDSAITGADPTMTITPNVGTAKSGIKAILATDNTDPILGIYYAVLDADSDTATTVDLSVTLPNNPFVGIYFNIWTVPSASLSSSTPTDSKFARNSSATSLSVTTLSTSSGGFIVAAGCSGNFATGSSAYSGSETTTMRNNASASSACHTCADASSVAAHSGDCTVTATFTTADNVGLGAVSWR